MNREDFDAWDRRIRERAELLWSQQGQPDGPRDRFLEEARELVAIEENPTSGQIDADEAAEPSVEEASLMRNLGEFPTLTDQGEEQSFPGEQDGIHLSDGDASDSGGVLPEEGRTDERFADIASGDADVSGTTFSTDQARPSGGADINDDGFPDQPPLDDDDDEDDDDYEDDDDDDDDDDEDDPDDDDPEDDPDAVNSGNERRTMAH